MRICARQFLLIAVLAGFAEPLFAQANDPRDNFAKAYASYTNKNPAQAKELFQKTVEATYRLADYSLYYLARIAFDESNWDQSRNYLAQLRQRYPQSIWFNGAALLRAKIDIAEKKYALAAETLRQLRADKSAPRELADEALFLQAQVHEARGNLNRAFTIYRDLRDASPTSRWAASARKEQARVRNKLPDQFALNTIDAQADEADRLARERQVNDAEELYKKILAAVGDPTDRLRYLAKLAALYLSAGGRNDAMPTLEQIARDYPDSSEAPKALYQIGQIYWNRHENARAFEYFKAILEKYRSSGYADRALYASADIHEYFGRREEAIQSYSNVQEQFPKSTVRDDAIWRLAWLYYRNGEFQIAQATFNILTQSKNGPFATASLYWQARIAEKLGDTETAKQLHRQIVNGGE
ncbi:MAG TPA: tetratricopeptide repeat protein, partial [Candidatus Binatus sp.]|nr:tetratricopeptide repeat protein [Candidatus Binatus sp.]